MLRISTYKLVLITYMCVTCVLILSSCNNDPIIHHARQLEYDVGGYHVNHPNDSTWVARSKREVFIIRNAPHDRDRLIKTIQNNEASTPIDKHFVEETYSAFYRYYFRESWRTPIDYVEKPSKFGFSDELHEHEDDLICKITMKKWPNAPDSLMYQWECSCPELEDMFTSK